MRETSGGENWREIGETLGINDGFTAGDTVESGHG